jgi:hypothetical protein
VAETEAKKPESSEIIVEIGSSRVVVRDDTDVELLSKVCKVLAQIC